MNEMLKYNKEFVEKREYEKYKTTKYPEKKIAILTCMDTRLMELLPASLGFKNGDIKIIKNAGGIISNPFGSVVRSLLIEIFELGVENIMVIVHTDCGVQNINSESMIKHMLDRGISQEQIDMIKYCGIDFNQWLRGFESVEVSVEKTVEMLRMHPLIPKDIHVSGYVMDSITGEMKAVDVCEE